MKVEGPRPGAPTPATRRPDAAAGGEFTPTAPNAGGARQVAPAPAAAAVPALSAVLALQAGDDLTLERRARQVRRGRRALDALEQLERAMLSAGALTEAHRALRLEGESALEQTGEPGLDDVLAQIEVRRAVELAKLEAAVGARPAS